MSWIDAHIHTWTPDTASYPLDPRFTPDQMKPPSFTPEELLAHCRPSGVERIVLIQMSFYGFDNRYMLEAIAAQPEVFRGVAVVDTSAPDLPETMVKLRAQGVRGFRVGVGGRPLESWAQDPGLRTMFHVAADEGMAVCPLIEPRALPSLREACEESPGTTVVIDHLCRIGVTGEIPADEVAALCAMADLPNVLVKVSAFYALGCKQPPHDELLPLIQAVIEGFGTGRLMWASDCPYQVQRESYESGLSLVRDRLTLSETGREQLLGGTAERVFFGD